MKKIKYIAFVLLFIIKTASAQWTMDTLPTPAYNMVVTQNGSKAIYADGTKFNTYDFLTNSWAYQNSSFARANMKAATANGVSYFGGGGFIGVYSYAFYKNVDIYKSASNTWSTASLSQARIVGAAAAIGNKVMFAGGRLILNYSNKVDIFNVNTGVRTLATLSKPRAAMAVGVCGGKVVFAGGESGNISMGNYTVSDAVDIYDNATGTWTSTLLSTKRSNIAVGVVGSRILFAGGIGPNGLYSNVVDIFDTANNTWSVATMSEGKYGIAVATAGNKVYFAGGTNSNSGSLSNRVEVYNSGTNTWSYVTISAPRMSMSVAKTSKRIMFGGGIEVWGNTGSNRVEVLTLATNTWSVEYLSQPRLGIATASYGNKAMFTGGAQVLSSYPQYSIISNHIDFWTDPVLRTNDQVTSESKNINVYPNPFKDLVKVTLNSNDQPAFITIYDLTGKTIDKFQVSEMQSELNLSYLKEGIYLFEIIQEGQKVQSIKMIKE